MLKFTETNYYILAKEYEYGQTCVLVHNADCPKVIGRLWDTEKFRGLDDFDVLNTPDWSIDVNDAWVRAGIDQEQTFLLASPIEGNLIQTTGKLAGQETVYARELRMLLEAGYEQIGSFMVHPAKVSTFLP